MSKEVEIYTTKFNTNSPKELQGKWFGTNWPVVYIIHNNDTAYIGETLSTTNRMLQHLKNTDRQKLTTLEIVTDERFNKSAILDIESSLIQYMSADGVYKLQNSNSGIKNHLYYDKPVYEAIFKTIWEKLKTQRIVHQDLNFLENLDVFKYTPYKKLTLEQYEVVFNIVVEIIESVKNERNGSFFISGEAGTGKTVLAMYMLKLISDQALIEFIENEGYEFESNDIEVFNYIRNLKVGFVVPMGPLRSTLKKVASKISRLASNMIIGPNDVIKDDYDVLIVDESHRLQRRVNIVAYHSYDNINRKLGFEKNGTQLDWIMHSSRFQIFFYDSSQTVKPSDVRKEDFDRIKTYKTSHSFSLASQLRVKGGADYVKYIKDLLNVTVDKKVVFSDYDFKLFDHISDMKNMILEKNELYGLSRMVSGYGWKWKTKNHSVEQIRKKQLYDIDIEDERLIWNSNLNGWVNSFNAINEVGSIHTIQGYDLNYAGVIIGPEVYYDKKNRKIEINKNSYYDTNGKKSILNDDELREYIINIYSVLLTRGIKGTYLYVYDKDLREYLSSYIELNYNK